MAERKIVHIDMDAFYASVEQRDDPSLRGRPVVVAWKGSRSVVCAASYEARAFGVRSAMPAVTAERLCPLAVFVPPDFSRYRAVSQAIREIMAEHTDLIEPLSLDEAYLDVTETKSGLDSGHEVAVRIRKRIREELSLTASAGVAPNKFLSKIASDWKKPNGLFEIKTEQIDEFLLPLAVGKLPGVGKVTEDRLLEMGLSTVGDIRKLDLLAMEDRFGTWGRRLYELARGIDESRVTPDRPTKSISAEDTFAQDLSLEETRPTIAKMADRVWEACQKEQKLAKTVVVKLKTSDFKILTRSHTVPNTVRSAQELSEIALWLLDKVGGEPETLYRLAGVGVSNLADAQGGLVQPTLF